MFFKNFGGGERKSKYGARSVEIDGIRFASNMEARFYLFFKDHNFEILELQPKFLLADAFEVFEWKTGKTKKFRKTEYVADFRIKTPDGDIFIIEAKGFETEAWKLKQKFFLKKYGQEEKLLVFKSLKEVMGFFNI